MKSIKRIDPKSVARVLGALYALVGLIGGLIVSVSALVAAASGTKAGIFGLAAIIVLPIIYGVVGLVFGYLLAYLYNLIAKKVGGVEFEVE
jgi:hypothetical protein